MDKVHSIFLTWPALMKLETASQYVSLDEQSFELMARRHSVYPVIVNGEENRWRKTDLDKMIRRLPENTAFASLTSNRRELYLDKDSIEELAIKIGEQLKYAEGRKSSSLLSIDETGGFLGVGRSTVYRLIEDGHLIKRKIGRRTLITRDSINLLLNQ